MMRNQDTHAARKKEKKSFAILTITEKKLPERFFIIDHNILMPKKQYFSSSKSPTHCLYHSQALATRDISLHSWTACTMNLWRCQEDYEDRQPQPCGKWSQTTCKTSVNGKVTAAEPPAHLPPPAYTHPPNKPPFWPWPQALKHCHGTQHSALHSLELNRHHNCYCSLIAR